MCRHLWALLVVVLWSASVRAELPKPTLTPLHVAADLNVGESQDVTLTDGKKVKLKLLDLKEERDTLRGAVRRAEVRVEVDGREVSLVSANYRLPMTIGGVQIDCPVTRGYILRATRTTGGMDVWGLDKDARLRVWPASSPLVNPGTFMYPARQRWFASATQMANEPVYVDGGIL